MLIKKPLGAIRIGESIRWGHCCNRNKTALGNFQLLIDGIGQG